MERIRIRYAKRGRLRFTSHRDFARALERAVRRAGVPIAYSSGFSPHPRISYASASPTGVASEAEYAELALHTHMDPEELRAALDAVLPDGLDVLTAVPAGGPDLAERVTGSHWWIELPGVPDATLAAAVDALLAAAEVPVQRMMKSGLRTLDARAPIVSARAVPGRPATGSRASQRGTSEERRGSGVGPEDAGSPRPAEPASAAAPGAVVQATGSTVITDADTSCAILDLVVRHVTPSVRPDDVLAGLRAVADLEPPVPARVTRLAQGTLTERGEIADPLLDRDRSVTGQPST